MIAMSNTNESDNSVHGTEASGEVVSLGRCPRGKQHEFDRHHSTAQENDKRVK